MKITVETIVKSDINSVWKAWNNPQDIKQWNAASEDWHTTSSTVDLRVGGSFTSRMEAKDGSMGFDFRGIYTEVKETERIAFVLEDGREVEVRFTVIENGIKVDETFEAETENDPDLQRQGWQNILDNFARHVETRS